MRKIILCRVYHNGDFRKWNHPSQAQHNITDLEGSFLIPQSQPIDSKNIKAFLEEMGFTGVYGFKLFVADSDGKEQQIDYMDI